MFYLVDNGKISVANIEDIEKDDKHHYWALFTFKEFETVQEKFENNWGIVFQPFVPKLNKFESHDGFDYISLYVLNYNNVEVPLGQVCVYFYKYLLLFVCDDTAEIQNVIDDIAKDTTKNITFGRLCYTLLDRITSQDAIFLENIEQEISDMESALISSKKKNYVKKIIVLRKKLMELKRYYEQLIDVLDGIQENENNLIDNKSMRYYKILAGRVDRLYHNVLNLRDYVTQVREAYQAEVDISLNQIMKLFTVITAIFLPLTLLVGWYGMNLKMPEYNWDYGYPMVIGISIFIVGISLYLFKKNKWF